ncbi:MAG: protein kinase [Planctomycetota bacterium]
MNICCPYCKHSSKPKVRKPGRFKLRCPQCDKIIRLEVEVLVHVLARDGTRLGDTSADALDRTLGSSNGSLHASARVPALTANISVEDSAATLAGELTGSGHECDDADRHSCSDVTRTASCSPDESAEDSVDSTPGSSLGDSLQDDQEGGDRQDLDRQPDDGVLDSEPDGPTEIVLGGYKVISELGRGAMGTVYVAEQISLQRRVAIKTIQSRIAQDPRSMARFTREAFAAAQLSHPNVVQISDMGCQDVTHYFSMELVKGGSLRSEIKKHGRIAPELALKYILQAARGLRHAHEAGMVHRDIKPDNLLISSEGLVKVADLGLVKVPDVDEAVDSTDSASERTGSQSQLTSVGSTMGTPAYMAPEQADSADEVDHRADIYSLGCTLYMMVTGKPPFSGSTAAEVITKHKSEPIRRPDKVFKHIPSELGELTERMTAKNVQDRFQNTGEVITAIETYLGLGDARGFSPSDEQLKTLENCAAKLQGLPLRRMHQLITRLFLVAMIVLPVLSILATSVAPEMGVAMLMFAVSLITASVASGWILGSISGQSVTARRVRQLVFASRWKDRFLWVGLGGLAAGVIFVSGQLGVVFLAVVLGIAASAALHFGITRRWNTQRRAIADEFEPALRRLRLQGQDEEVVRDFVAKFAGNHWEELFELLFGYDAKIETREKLSRQERFKRMPRFEAWQDPFVRWVDQRLEQEEKRRSQRLLRSVEAASLIADGTDPVEADAIAQSLSVALVSEVSQPRDRGQQSDPAAARRRRKAMYEQARREAMKVTPYQRIERLVHQFLDPVIGVNTRFAVALILLSGFAFRLYQNGVAWEGEPLTAAITLIQQPLESIQIPGVPSWCIDWASDWYAAAAGVWLFLSCLIVSTRKASLCAIAGAVVCILGLPVDVPLLTELIGAGWADVAVGVGGGLITGWITLFVPIPFLND